MSLTIDKLRLYTSKTDNIKYTTNKGNVIVTISEKDNFIDAVDAENISPTKIPVYHTPLISTIGTKRFTLTTYKEDIAAVNDNLSLQAVKILHNKYNTIYDLSRQSSYLYNNYSYTFSSTSLITLLQRNINALTSDKAKVKFDSISVMFILNNKVKYERSYINTLIKEELNNSSVVVFNYDILFMAKDLDGTILIRKVVEAKKPVNITKVRSLYIAMAQNAYTKKEIAALTKGDSVVTRQNEASKEIEKLVSKGLVLDSDLTSIQDKTATQKAKDTIKLKVILHALGDENTVEDSYKYDKKKFDKALASITKDREKISKIIKELKSKQLPPKTDKIDFTANDARTVYNSKDFVTKDIVHLLDSFKNDVEAPLVLKDVSKEDTSTDLTSKYTYTIEFLEPSGKKFKTKIDLPKIDDTEKGTYKIEGIDYILYNQLVMKPIVKIKPTVVALTTSANKGFFERVGENNKNSAKNLLLKTIYNSKDIIYTSYNSDKDSSMRVDTSYLQDYNLSAILDNFLSITIAKDIFISFSKDAFLPEKKYLKTVDKDGTYLVIGKTLDNKTIYVIDKESSVYTISNKKLDDIKPMNISLFSLLLKLTKTKTTKSSFYSNMTQVKILGKNIPLVLLLMARYSLKTILERYGIKYTITLKGDKKPSLDSSNQLRLDLANGSVTFNYSNIEQRLLINGLSKVSEINGYTLEELYSKNNNLLVIDYQSNNFYNGLKNYMYNNIDSLTMSIIKDSLVFIKDDLDVYLYINTLLKDNMYTKESDLSGYRIRSAEAFPAMLYKAIADAHKSAKRSYNRIGKYNFFLPQDKLLRDSITSLSNFSNYSTSNINTELDEKSKVVLAGFGGINSTQSITMNLREVNESNNGILDPVYSVDNAKVGAIRYLTFSPNVKDIRGNITKSSYKDVENDIYSGLSTNNVIEPYLASHSDSSRVYMGEIQARHMLPISNPEFYTAPKIRTGVEKSIVNRLSSDWVIRPVELKGAGTVSKIDEKNKVIHITETKSKKKIIISYADKIADYSSQGLKFTTEFSINPDIKVGSIIDSSAVLATDKSLIKGDDTFSRGKMLRVSLVPHSSLLEDGVVVSDGIVAMTKTKLVYEDETVIPGKLSIGTILKDIGSDVVLDDTIIELKDKNSDDKDSIGFDILDDVLVRKITAKYTGKIKDIKFYYNVEQDTLTEPEIQLIKKLEAIDKMHGYKGDDKHVFHITSNVILGRNYKNVKILKIFIETEKTLNTGSKVTMQNIKGCYTVWPKEEMPRTLDGEPIDIMISTFSLITRMVTSVLMNIYMNKIIILLEKRISEMKDDAKIMATVTEWITTLYKGDKEDMNSELSRYKQYGPKKIRSMAKNKKLYLNVKPFSEPSLDNIVKTAKALDIPLEEKLYFPKQNNVVTSKPTVVGYTEIKFLSQIDYKKSSYSYNTGNLDSIKGNITASETAANISLDEAYNLFAYGLPEAIRELAFVRSDDRDAARSMERQAIDTGAVELDKLSSSGIGQTQRSLASYLLAAGIYNDIIPDTSVSVDGSKVDTRAK